MRASRIRPLAVLSLTCSTFAACSFDSTGHGFPDGASLAGIEGGSSDDAPGSDPGSDRDPDAETGEDAAGGAGDTGGSAGDRGESGPSDAGGGDTGTAATEGADDDADAGAAATTVATDGAPEPAACPIPMFELMWADAGELVPPMALIESDADGNPEVAYSTAADSGAVKLTIEFACPGEYALWGLVWDYLPGAFGGADPDSFYFDVGGAESVWRYGCQTGNEDSGLSWQRLAALDAQPCDATYVSLSVAEAGPIELTLRNRESGYGSAVAGIAAIAVSSDPNADPSTLYQPY